MNAAIGVIVGLATSVFLVTSVSGAWWMYLLCVLGTTALALVGAAIHLDTDEE